MTEAFRIFVYMSYVYVYYAVSSRPYYKQQWGKRRQTRQRKKDMAVILNNPLSKLIISRGNHHTFLRHALIMVVKREVYFGIWRRGGSVVERRTRDLEAPSSNPTTAV